LYTCKITTATGWQPNCRTYYYYYYYYKGFTIRIQTSSKTKWIWILVSWKVF